MPNVPPFDGSQWKVVEGPLTCEVISLRYARTWNVGYKLLRDVFKRLDKTSIDSILEGPCSCKTYQPSCSTLFHPLEYMEGRMNMIYSRDSKVVYLTNLQHHKDKKKKGYIKYFFRGKLICRKFFRCVFQLRHEDCNDLSSNVQGDTQWEINKIAQKSTIKKYETKVTHRQMC